MDLYVYARVDEIAISKRARLLLYVTPYFTGRRGTRSVPRRATKRFDRNKTEMVMPMSGNGMEFSGTAMGTVARTVARIRSFVNGIKTNGALVYRRDATSKRSACVAFILPELLPDVLQIAPREKGD